MEKLSVDAQNTTSQDANNDEISLIDLFAVLLKRKKLIIAMTAVGAVFSVVFSIITIVMSPEKSPLPNQYTPKAVMLINDSSSSGGALASMVASTGLGGLLGGKLGGGSSHSALAQYLVHSDSTLDAIVNKFNLVEKWEIEKSPITNSRKALKEVLSCNFESENGVFTVSFTDIDPVFACEVVNYCMGILEKRFYELGLDSNQLEKDNLEKNIASCLKEIENLQSQIHDVDNSVSNIFRASGANSIALEVTRLKLELSAQEQIYKQLKTQYELVKIDIASKTPVFQVLEKAQVPDQKSKPSRGKLCVIITFAAGFVSVFLAFLLNAIENIRNDKEAMAKLRG